MLPDAPSRLNLSALTALTLLLGATLAAWLPPLFAEPPNPDLRRCRSIEVDGVARYVCGAALASGPCPAPAGTRATLEIDGRCTVRPLPAATRLRMGLRLSVNTEPTGGLVAVPGIGRKTAERIVAARPFAQIGDLTRVRGIGVRRLRRLRRSLRR